MVGAGVFALWVGLDGHYPLLAERSSGFNPSAAYGPGSLLAPTSPSAPSPTLVVLPLEEVFYRSFVYRYLVRPDFLGVPPGTSACAPSRSPPSSSGSATSKGSPASSAPSPTRAWSHKNRLGDVITAHAVTTSCSPSGSSPRSQHRFW